jgi:DNA-binding CsgD family transcriptional regulator
MGRRRAENVPSVRTELSKRQREVLSMIGDGATNGEIAERLGLSLDGAKWHVREIFSRLGVDSREEAAAWWKASGRRMGPFAWSPVALVAGAGIAGVAGALVAVALVLNLSGGEPATVTDSVPTPTISAQTQLLASPSPFTTRVVGPAWLTELPENVQNVARAVVDGDRATLERALHFRPEAGFGIFHARHCQGGPTLQTPDEVVELLIDISVRDGVLAEAALANEDAESANLVHFLVFQLRTPEEPRTVVVDGTGVIAIFEGCGQKADFFAGNGNGTVWR